MGRGNIRLLIHRNLTIRHTGGTAPHGPYSGTIVPAQGHQAVSSKAGRALTVSAPRWIGSGSVLG